MKTAANRSIANGGIELGFAKTLLQGFQEPKTIATN